MIKNRDEFFGMLWEDYISFDEKERDKYILLKSAYLAMERYEVMTEEEYVGILKELIGNSVPKKIGSCVEGKPSHRLRKRWNGVSLSAV